MKGICKKFPKTIMFLGLAGSGKDTQADLVCSLCDGQKISTGDLARAEVKSGSALGRVVNKYILKGLLIPDDIMYKILRSQLATFDNNKLWVFSGTVRTTNQISMFDETLGVFDRNLGRVIFLELSDKSIINRLSKRRFCPKCGATYHPDFKKSKVEGICDKDGERLVQRDDDKPEVIKTRIKVERKAIEPVLNEYEKRSLLLRINGEPSIQEIHKLLVEKLANEG